MWFHWDFIVINLREELKLSEADIIHASWWLMYQTVISPQLLLKLSLFRESFRTIRHFYV